MVWSYWTAGIRVLGDPCGARDDRALPAKVWEIEEGDFAIGNALKLEFPDEYFDTVLCMGVIDHIADPQRAIGGCSECCDAAAPCSPATLKSGNEIRSQRVAADVQRSGNTGLPIAFTPRAG